MFHLCYGVGCVNFIIYVGNSLLLSDAWASAMESEYQPYVADAHYYYENTAVMGLIVYRNFYQLPYYIIYYLFLFYIITFYSILYIYH